MPESIDELFGGPDAPNPEAQTPNDVEDIGPDEFSIMRWGVDPKPEDDFL